MKTKSFALATVKATKSDDPNGSFEAILSAPTTDRDNEVVQAGAFGDLPDHITIDVDHGLTMASTIGSGTPYYDGDLLKIKGTFSSIPRGQEARALVNEGHITKMSVAYIPLEKIKGKAVGEPTTVTKAELLNAAFVSVPSNRGADVLSSKAGARNSKADAAHIQAIHDSAASLGADCSGMKAVHGGIDTKAVAGSYEDRQEDIQEALVEANTAAIATAYPNSDPGEYGWLLRIVATFDDRVVYRIGWDEDAAYQVTYTWDGEVATVTGTPEPVEIDQVVTPAPAGETATRSAKPDAAAMAADVPADAETRERLALRVRALQYPAAV